MSMLGGENLKPYSFARTLCITVSPLIPLLRRLAVPHTLCERLWVLAVIHFLYCQTEAPPLKLHPSPNLGTASTRILQRSTCLCRGSRARATRRIIFTSAAAPSLLLYTPPQRSLATFIHSSTPPPSCHHHTLRTVCSAVSSVTIVMRSTQVCEASTATIDGLKLWTS
jgi:hypothetical protein